MPVDGSRRAQEIDQAKDCEPADLHRVDGVPGGMSRSEACCTLLVATGPSMCYH